ncbi:alanine--tRNA ligase, chloroplastic/mitochondrial isoform X1 [Macadamia integrifolia]|uniref:alanine--tRNA ligase, chloroplastic/mitochondrial isoform X1 n=2 Tax=Macadamia integrifolia TaxID=60698 RepID=UPI001C4F8F51|nr:alanine--tRNA ligase, chloroplastic/mitochondrial isoform X1 [Macadamia integrifolia]
MEGLKLADTSHSNHGRKPLIPLATSSLPSGRRFLKPAKGSLAVATGCKVYMSLRMRNLVQVSPSIMLYGHSKLKKTREIWCSSASIKPATKEMMKDMPKDLPVSGDSIRCRFLDFYASHGHKILPSSSLVPDDPTVLLTIAGMLQFKPIFLGKEPRKVARATTSQRCIRTNDVENVGQTSRHHTFFEMLGNFSFGDYFKREAINWAWELSTKEFGLEPERLWISVFEDDDEAFSIWHDEVGVPVERIKRMGEDDNFWTSGVSGPCGPCSEIYYDFYPERGDSDADLGDDSRFIEFYNLVFMQYNKRDDGFLEPLKQKNIDTGLGLERMARILQKVPNNYETDLIFPIIEKAAELAVVSYAKADDRIKCYLKVIGDHMRAVVYLISDGVVPSNIGRGYVVRRLIRRVVRTGRLLGIKEDGNGNLEGTFVPLLAEKVIELSSKIDSDVKTRAPRILEELKREELRFVQTLERGEKLLEQLLTDASLRGPVNGGGPCLSGKDAFLLYDTYGFPIEITMEVAQERGVRVDMEGFDREMDNQRRQSQAAHNVVKLAVGNASELTESVPDTEFLGYDTLSARAIVEGLMVNGKPVIQVSEGSDVEIMLNKTPFYAESGGQIGDHGYLYVPDAESSQKAIVEIKDVQKSLGNIFVHKGTIREGAIEVGREVEAAVNANLRQRAKVHHTATHLLQSALKLVIGQETSQAGSLVAFDRLRFDFNFHRPLLNHEIVELERLINGWISDATCLQTKVMSLTDAKRAGAIAMFGEKYGEQVRVVEVPGVSMELCGGTHVGNTSEIRGFKIISEQGIASGIRRIEAVAGDAFIDYVNIRDNCMRHLCSTLKVKDEDVTTRVESLLEELRMVKNEIASVRVKAAVYKASTMATKAFSVGASKKTKVLVENMDDIDADSLKHAAEYLVNTLQDPVAVVLGSCPGEEKVSLVAAFSPAVVALGLQAGKFIGPIAKMCGGGGGGRPNIAQAGGRKPENLSNALEKARTELIATLSEKAS